MLLKITYKIILLIEITSDSLSFYIHKLFFNLSLNMSSLPPCFSPPCLHGCVINLLPNLLHLTCTSSLLHPHFLSSDSIIPSASAVPPHYYNVPTQHDGESEEALEPVAGCNYNSWPAELVLNFVLDHPPTPPPQHIVNYTLQMQRVLGKKM